MFWLGLIVGFVVGVPVGIAFTVNQTVKMLDGWDAYFLDKNE